MKVVIIGANGQLGSEIVRVFAARGHEVLGLTHDIFDVTDAKRARELLCQAKPDVVINTSAMHNVEECEKEPLQAFSVNAVGARNLAFLSEEFRFPLAHFSTDYVFDGKKSEPYVETDVALPLNAYGNSKLGGENFVRTIASRHYVIRVSGLFGISPCRAKKGLNFIQLMLKLAQAGGTVRVVDHERTAPTYTVSIAEQLERLMSTGAYGLYHMVSSQGCSWYQFAKQIFKLTGTAVDIQVAGPNDFPAKVPRPEMSVMRNAALLQLGINQMPHWEEGLRRYLRDGGLLA